MSRSLSVTGVRDQLFHALWAASIASSTWPGLNSSKVARISSVAGFIDSIAIVVSSNSNCTIWSIKSSSLYSIIHRKYVSSASLPVAGR